MVCCYGLGGIGLLGWYGYDILGWGWGEYSYSSLVAEENEGRSGGEGEGGDCQCPVEGYIRLEMAKLIR